MTKRNRRKDAISASEDPPKTDGINWSVESLYKLPAIQK